MRPSHAYSRPVGLARPSPPAQQQQRPPQQLPVQPAQPPQAQTRPQPPAAPAPLPPQPVAAGLPTPAQSLQATVQAPPAQAGGPSRTTSVALSGGSFDDEFGDGSDLADMVDIVSTNIQHHYAGVKTEPGIAKPAQPAATPQLPQQPPPPQPAPGLQYAQHARHPTPAQQSHTVPAPQPQPVQPSPPIHQPQSLQRALFPPANSTPTVAAPASIPSATIAPTNASLDPVERIRQLEQQLTEKMGENKLLRNRAEAFEKRSRHAELAAAATAAASNAMPFSSSQMPMSQMPMSQSSHYSTRKQETEAAQRAQAQIDAAKAAQESAEMQSAEWQRENALLRRKMEAMEKQQMTMQQQMRNHRASAGGAASATPHAANAAAAARPMMSIAAATTPMSVLPAANSLAVAASSIGVPSILASSRLPAQRWQPPAFLGRLISPLNPTLLSAPPPPLPLAPAFDFEKLAQLLFEVQHASTTVTASLSGSKSLAVRHEQKDSGLTADDDVLDRLVHNLIITVQAVLHQTAPLSSLLLPLRPLLLTCNVLFGAAAPSIAPLASPMSVVSVTSPAMLTAPTKSSPVVTAAGSSGAPSKTVSSTESYDRSVRVKIEHGVAPPTTAAILTKPPSPAPVEPKRAATVRHTSVKPTTKALLSLLLQLLRFCVRHDVLSAQQVYDELVDPLAVTTPTSAIRAALPTKRIPLASVASLANANSLNALWSRQSAQVAPVKSPPTPLDRATPLPTPSAAISEPLTWHSVLVRVFDDAFIRLHVSRGTSTAAITAASAMSATVLAVLEQLVSVLQIVCATGVNRSSVALSAGEAKEQPIVGEEIMLTAWLPRLTQLIARIHANSSLRSPIQVPNGATLEQHIHASISQLVSRWCHQSSSSFLLLSCIQPASQIAISGLVQSTSAEAASPCCCSVLQLLLLFFVRQVATTRKLALCDDADSAQWCQLGVNLIDATRRCYSHRLAQDGRTVSLSICPVHGREWCERDADVSLHELTRTLFALPFTPFRVLLTALHDAAAQLQICTQRQVRAIVPHAYDHDPHGQSEDDSSLWHTCTVPTLEGTLRVLTACLRIQQRRWREILADPAWVTALHSPSQQEHRLDTMLQEAHEACRIVRQCQQQLKAASPAAERETRAGYPQAWSEAIRLASELSAWFSA